jgi:hypothetical protein
MYFLKNIGFNKKMGPVVPIAGALIAAGGAVASSKISSDAQKKAARRQEEAQRELQKQAEAQEKRTATQQVLTEERAGIEASYATGDVLSRPTLLTGGLNPLNRQNKTSRKTLLGQ